MRVAFFIVVERKGLGRFQFRCGPNKPSVIGIVQALADGVKLIRKEIFFPRKSRKGLYMSGPLLIFLVSFGG